MRKVPPYLRCFKDCIRCGLGEFGAIEDETALYVLLYTRLHDFSYVAIDLAGGFRVPLRLSFWIPRELSQNEGLGSTQEGSMNPRL